MTMTHLSLMAQSMMSVPLKGQKLVDRRHGGCVARADPDFGATQPIDFLIGDATAPSCHNGRARHGFGVHLEGLSEISGLERGSDVAHVLADPRDTKRVGTCVAVEDDPPAVGEVFKDVCRGVLVHPHHRFAACLHGGEGAIGWGCTVGRATPWTLACDRRTCECEKKRTSRETALANHRFEICPLAEIAM